MGRSKRIGGVQKTKENNSTKYISTTATGKKTTIRGDRGVDDDDEISPPPSSSACVRCEETTQKSRILLENVLKLKEKIIRTDEVVRMVRIAEERAKSARAEAAGLKAELEVKEIMLQQLREERDRHMAIASNIIQIEK